MYQVYVLYSRRFNRIYIGYTSNLQERMRSHNEFAKKGWTIRYRPWILVYTEDFLTKSDALKREKTLKTARGRRFIREELLSR